MRQAEKLGYKVKLSPKRIGPLEDHQIAQLGLGKFEEHLGNIVVEGSKTVDATSAAMPRKINIMLFDTAESVKKPIGSASMEAERATISLKGGK